MKQKSTQDVRRKRVRRLKRIIITSLVCAILFPIIFCFLLLYRVHNLEEQLVQISNLYENQGEIWNNLNKEEPDEQQNTQTEESSEERTDDDIRKVYLTFDDGPSMYTERILDILDQYHVKATFFVTGEEAVSHPERYQDIVERGHTVGMHSYSHKYSDIYASVQNFTKDLKKLQDFLYDTTGIESNLYRFPGGSSNTVSTIPMKNFCDYLKQEKITYFDWNISSKDASIPTLTADEIVENCTENLEKYQNAVILMHDSAEKKTTVEALAPIIEKIISMDNTQLLPITEDTVIVQHKNMSD